MNALRLALAQYPIEEPATLSAYLGKLTAWCEEAAGAGAQLLVFPEYAGAEAMAVFGRAANRDLSGATEKLQDLLPAVDDHLAALAARLGVWIVGPSAPRRTGDRLVNRASVFSPDGILDVQDKAILTPFDREEWRLSGGDALTLFETPFGKVGVLICYDVEFPLLARDLAARGAALLVCPSCTDTLAGYWRVRIGAQARALENQCAVVQAPTVGEAPWTRALDVNRGAAGLFLPPDQRSVPDGVAKLGRMDEPGWVHAEVGLDAVTALRERGEVRGFRDWDEQARVLPD
ncbi:nitrilase-related carbon-nitrogen hydrolase [Parvularcula dongshanensis]|uniref:Putative amidohydrolase n=1 Tax=Parvularcula dongshanensis TaxID=1173995 RepID=A0A840I5W8_9PROT|nr:putative amidohydrolase [Parvularcula dongshanensis]